MKTAIEWLEEQLYKSDWNTLNHDEKMNICSTAKLMEMDQIKNAYHEGLTDIIPMDYYNNTFKSLKTNKTNALQKSYIKRSIILNLTENDKLKRSDKLWNKLIKKLSVLQDNNYTARQLFDYIERHYM